MNTQRTKSHGLSILSVAAAMVLAGGCESTEKPRGTQREEATKQWNHARAGVMANLARDQFQGGSFDKARATVNDAITADPENASLYVMSARIAIEQDALGLADTHLTEARRLNPKDSEAMYLSGVVAQRWQKYDQALAYYTQAVGENPAELAYLMARAEMLVILDRQVEAQAALRAKLVFFENSAAIRDAVAQLLMQQKKFAEAAELFRQASVLSPKDLSIRERLASALFQSGDVAASGEILGSLLQTPAYGGRVDLWLMLGDCQIQVGRFVEARVTFQKTSELDPSNVDTWLGLSKAAIAGQDLRRAEASARRAQALAPQRSECHLVLGYVYLEQERLDDAMVCFQTAARLDPTDSVSICLIGVVQDRRGEHQQALSSYGQALRANPNDDLAAKLLATVPID